MGTANTSVAAQGLSPLLDTHRRRQSTTSRIGRTQRIGKRVGCIFGKRVGDLRISNPFAVVLTLIATVVGAAWATVTAEAGPMHVALSGAPVQVTVNIS